MNDFYNALFNNKIKSVKQMRKILIKIIEKSYNKKIKTNKHAMMIFDEERHLHCTFSPTKHLSI